MLFLNFSSEKFDDFKTKFHEVAVQYKGKGLNFLLGDTESSKGAFQVISTLAISSSLYLVVLLTRYVMRNVVFSFGFV